MQQPNEAGLVQEMPTGRKDAVEKVCSRRFLMEHRAAHVEEDMSHVVEGVASGVRHRPSSVGMRKVLPSPLWSCVPSRPQGEPMVEDPTSAYFAGTERDRAAFEAGIKLGSILHQYVGIPLADPAIEIVERAIEAAVRVQPLVEDARVRIDRDRLRVRGPYRYGILTEDLLDVEVTVGVGATRAVGVLRYVPELDYPLMYLKDIGKPTKG